jgi:anti-anti-sigma regulatory factor
MFTPTAEPNRDGDRFTVTSLGGCVRLQFTGEIDQLSHGQLQSTLAALHIDGITAIHLDMSKLEFADISATRELMTFAQAHPGLRLILYDPPASLQRILTLLGPGTNLHTRVGSKLQSTGPQPEPGHGDPWSSPGTIGPASSTARSKPNFGVRLAGLRWPRPRRSRSGAGSS